MAEFSDVPVVEINNDNFKEMWPTLLLAIKSSTFLALDAELSGLGERKQLFARSMDDRYKGMCDVAKTRSIVSLGISCFKSKPGEVTDTGTAGEPINNGNSCITCYDVQTFNIFVLCNENYVVEPLSLKFLVEHGFDFNRQYDKGLPYHRGNDKKEDLHGGQQTVRELFTNLVVSKVPIVLHNGLVDLIFFYHNFYAEVPTSLQTFLADMAEVFSGGIYDTKFITEYKARLSASFLEYVFRKCQRENSESHSNSWSHVKVSFLKYPSSLSDQVTLLPCAIDDRLDQKDGKNSTPCPHFSAHGWCAAGPKCSNSHDVDAVLDSESKATGKRRKRRRKDHGDRDPSLVEEEEEECCDSDRPAATSDSDMKKSRTAGHRAGFDAFMTGFIFAFYAARYGKKAGNASDAFVVEEFHNKVFLSGKDFPLTVGKSNFAKYSKDHMTKIGILKTR